MRLSSTAIARPGRLIALAAALASLLTSLPAGAIESTAKQAFIVDFQTGTVLYAKDADVAMHPSSMSKLMTIYLIFERLKQGKIKLADTLPVSERAWKMQGSKMFTPLNSQISVEDLLRGIIIQSGNDACVVLAEGLAGSEQAYVELMNQKARELGLKDSHFACRGMRTASPASLPSTASARSPRRKTAPCACGTSRPATPCASCRGMRARSATSSPSTASARSPRLGTTPCACGTWAMAVLFQLLRQTIRSMLSRWRRSHTGVLLASRPGECSPLNVTPLSAHSHLPKSAKRQTYEMLTDR